MVNEQKKLDNSGKSVLVGMTGSLDSTVAAYLLKKQGYMVTGISLIMMDKEEIVKPEEDDFYNRNKKKNQPKNKEEVIEYEVTGTCYIEDLKRVQTICESLDIGFYGVDARKLYQDRVIDRLVAAKLSGMDFNPCVACNSVKIEMLLEKAKILKADFVATGHYAKIFTNHQTGECSLLSANDVANDQSFFLSALSKDHLKLLLLPFGDIRRIEVEKIAKSLSVDFVEKKERCKRLCFIGDPRLDYFVEKRSPISMREEGTFINYEDNTTNGEHKGIYAFTVGQKELQNTGGTLLEKDYQVIRIDGHTEMVYISKEKHYFWNILTLDNTILDDSLDLSKPFTCYALVYPNEKKVECQILVRNNGQIILQTAKKIEGLLNKGRMVTLYIGDQIGSKIIGSGQIYTHFHYEKGKWMRYPEPEGTEEDHENSIRSKPVEKMEF